MSSFTGPVSSSLPSEEIVRSRPTCHIIVGMAGSGKTTYMAQLTRHLGSGMCHYRPLETLPLS